MPVYDFECPKCGDKRTQTISLELGDFKPICKCGAEMQKVYSFTGVKFNGSGFYSTDKKK
jgi:putative FmdB family regulatory protein